ncbi:hypothetical protein GJ744_008195 [Endocarpon pusillum]|uniref:Pre-mRNA-splicing factor 38B n=1 Tax=Endocarpon pusillum TaxID=364733 RepID=A0A8H7ALQ6_9EURO|nr:hypothetical protein GJ744_008195 [Endocarpon pusillum]
MPPSDDITSDEYVAKLLAEDARKSSIRYSSMGLTALLPKRATNSAPKPNTRFLQSILRETDSHNAALKKKEELEARLRLQNIKDGNAFDVQANSKEGKKRRRDIDDRDSELRDQKRISREEDSRSRARDRHKYRQPHRSSRHDVSSSDEHEAGNNKHRRSHRRDQERRNQSLSSDQDRRHKRTRGFLSDSSTPGQRGSRRHKRKGQSEHPRSHRRKAGHSRSRSPDSNPLRCDSQKTGSASPPVNRRRKPSPPLSPTPSSSSTTSSDPLESIVGPLPPAASKPTSSKTLQPRLISRGRNSYRRSSTSQIDTHFSPSYDPSLDRPPQSTPSSPSSPSKDKDRDDWDLALEALRDREIWKKKGADRLREAGFGEGEVKRWEEAQSAVASREREREKGAEDVKWNRKGEQREWDAGKVVFTGDKEPDQLDTAYRAAGAGAGAGAKGRRDLKGEIGLEAAWKRKGKGKAGGLLGEMTRALA